MEATESSTPPPTVGGAPVPRTRRPTALVRDLFTAGSAFEKSLQRELAVNPTGLDAMGHLVMSGPLSPGELSRRLDLTTAATTAAIDRLVDLGHVTRMPHPTDRRSVLVVPTESSVQRAMGHLMPMIAGVDAVLDEFDDAEQRIIERYLERVVATYGLTDDAEPSMAVPRAAR
ncbi:MarR family winged helix-turn-helix transcriptional regulator [uncultured Microbacterium sp.]|uniref:MarR family winged helix-turn-helix transcriptional regulator n=1 Tax=uncultured Microbacterium sp. TaxID=191216 RepID=UPI0025D3AD21|nr:MarR family transcriptional regulator [uncultured Microbacterium sp.]